MSADIAISVQSVSKAYRIWNDPSARLKSPVFGGISSLFPKYSKLRRQFECKAAAYYRDFYALKGISFQVRKGESVGIIGRNGSGKSTLLQIIAGTLQPTTGSVSVQGRVAALLELGSGFNPEFTGRENVYLNAAVLGLTRAETDAKFDSIAAFADIGDFLDQPVKTYSSGMLIRLAFAVAVSVEPEILVVDEALSVGDVFFQQKCFQRVRQMLDGGVSLLYVSHDTTAMQNLCNRAVLLKDGETVYEGPPEEAVSRYYAVSTPSGVTRNANTVAHGTSSVREQQQNLLDQHDMRRLARSEHGAGDLVVEQVAVFNSQWVPTREFRVEEVMHVVASLRAKRPIAVPSSGIHLYDRMNNLVFAAGTRQRQVPFDDFAEGESRVVEFQLVLSVQPGEYTFSVGCSQASAEGPNLGYIQNRLEGLGPITVSPSPLADGTWPFYGHAKLPLEIKIHG